VQLWSVAAADGQGGGQVFDPGHGGGGQVWLGGTGSVPPALVVVGAGFAS
jgi:hypothetical protein